MINHRHKPVVLSIQTPLLGHRTYGKILRGAFESSAIDFQARWSDEQQHIHEQKPLETQLQRLFLKAIERPSVRERNLDFLSARFELGTSYWARRTLNQALRTTKPDVLHFHTQAISFLSLDLIRKVPSVISGDCSSYQMAEQNVEPSYRWTFAANHLLEKLSFERAKVIIMFSEWARQSVIEDHKVDPAKVFSISPGVPVDRFPPEPPSRHRGASARVKRILFVGGEFERKGGPTLLHVFRSRFAERTNVELHIVTDSRSIIPKGERVFVHTNVQSYTPKWHALYEAADVLALPTHREPFGHVYLEAAASWLPVVGSTVGAGPELVVDRQTGFIVQPNDEKLLGDKLALILENDDLATRLGAAGRAKVEIDHNSQVNAGRVERLFTTLAQDRNISTGGGKGSF